MKFYHQPVLLKEVIRALDVSPSRLFIDGTLGGGGHAREILSAGARVVGIDRDIDAISACGEALKGFGDRIIIRHAPFSRLGEIADSLDISGRVDGVLMDLGVSSYQLDNPERGFGIRSDAFLDMRMDRTKGMTAAELINSASEDELTDILYSYGEEKWARRIAKFIAERRTEKPIETTFDLTAVIKSAVPAACREADQHPARRTFQAVRIRVNNELGELEEAISQSVRVLKPGGKLAVITFHSLEDRIVKERFKFFALDCVCPPEFPVCVCGKKTELKVLTKKPILPSEEEIAANPRSRSAKLRVAEKI